MKKRDRNFVRQNEVKVRDLPADAMDQVKKLIDSAKQEEKVPEHVER
jgi:hypothetical protein